MRIFFTILLLILGFKTVAQDIDTLRNYKIEEVSVKASRRGTFISTTGASKMEVISQVGLMKMACCNVAESFENSASVTVGYSDAISGARQIKLLGLKGIYTQMLDESRPVMRGLGSPYGLSYTPGSWLTSIQTTKGISSVTAGHEAISGQINLEYRKPTEGEPLFVNAYIDQDLRTELNLSSSFYLNDRLSTVILAHGSIDPRRIDHNGDGFMDIPTTGQINLANRWLYSAPSGIQLRAGVKFVREERKSGQMDRSIEQYWGSQMDNKAFNGYFKMGIPTDTVGSNLAMVVDYNFYEQNSYFGPKRYDGLQNSLMGNLFYHWRVSKSNTLVIGASTTLDYIAESIGGSQQATFDRQDRIAGVFGEYTYNYNDIFSLILGLRADYGNFSGWFYTPRSHIKWNITPRTTFRASAGLGYRASQMLTDNLGVLATGRDLIFADNIDRMERGVTYGGSLTQTFRLGGDENASLSFDYFSSRFYNQVVADQEFNTDQVVFYNPSGRSFTNTYQADFVWQPIERFEILATFRWNDTRIDLAALKGVEKPLVDRFKGLINLQYATKFRRWVFDFTAQTNGQSRLPDGDMDYSPVYQLYFAQITRKFRTVDIYLGCENIGNFKQHNPILSPEDPFSKRFNSSVIWGPLMGRKFYAGIRFTLK